jgi:hypothetical protein
MWNIPATNEHQGHLSDFSSGLSRGCEEPSAVPIFGNPNSPEIEAIVDDYIRNIGLLVDGHTRRYVSKTLRKHYALDPKGKRAKENPLVETYLSSPSALKIRARETLEAEQTKRTVVPDISLPIRIEKCLGCGAIAVGVDFDDVIVPCMKKLVEFCERTGFGNGSLETLEEVSFAALYPEKTAVELREMFDSFTESPEWEALHEIPPPEGCAEKLREFESAGFRLISITARRSEFGANVERYLDRFLNGLFDKVVCCNYYLLPGEDAGRRRTKADVCAEEGCVILIDDNPRYVEEVEAAGSAVGVLFGEWNWSARSRSSRLESGKRVAKNWSDVAVPVVAITTRR